MKKFAMILDLAAASAYAIGLVIFILELGKPHFSQRLVMIAIITMLSGLVLAWFAGYCESQAP